VALLVSAGAPAAAADKRAPPQVPLAAFWSVPLTGAASAPPLRDGDRIFVALKSAHLTARAVADGHELWRITKDVTGPMAADGGLLFVSAGEAIEAVRGADGGTAWIVPRVKAVAPLVSRAGWVIAVTDTEIIAIEGKDGRVVWRHPAGGVRLPPAIDGEHLYTGADDGRILALTLASGVVAWERYLPLGISTIAAYDGRVYAGAGNKQFYCLDGRAGKEQWLRRIGANATGRIAMDDDHVYFTALDNVVYALDRSNGNQRWTSSLRRRPIAGVVVAGHVVFVPAISSQFYMFYDRDGRPSGAIELPSEIARDAPPDVRETPAGVNVFAVTRVPLADDWQLTYAAPVDDSGLVPLANMTAMPGLPFLTDPRLEPIGRVLGSLVMGDPDLRPLSELGFPIVLQDPPLQPLRTLPGLQLRPLSPVLPARRGE